MCYMSLILLCYCICCFAWVAFLLYQISYLVLVSRHFFCSLLYNVLLKCLFVVVFFIIINFGDFKVSDLSHVEWECDICEMGLFFELKLLAPCTLCLSMFMFGRTTHPEFIRHGEWMFWSASILRRCANGALICVLNVHPSTFGTSI